MLSPEIFVNALAFTKRPILKTIPAFGIGSKLCPERSSVSQSCCGRRQYTTPLQKNYLKLFLKQFSKMSF
ncbi:hypothetical protein EGT49_09310 [Companilactobacillus suantsaicola]|uniref:Uncharacterized protein n=1 Tax=Companilactobacillus suantsaicola TaxID=2487723 RepID=A0A4Z0JJP2_9LACO|nr:hypothetical protein EGT49_09310 [Companilactobacillus suantsaicola]